MKLRILHLTKKYPNALGGDAVVVSYLQKHQEAAGHHVTILTSNCKDIIAKQFLYKFGMLDKAAGLDHITFRRLFSLVGLFFKSFIVFSKERPDVIHTHSIDLAFCASFAARFYGIPLLHTFHIVTFYDDTQPRLRRKSELWLARFAAPRAITVPNAYDKNRLIQSNFKQTVLLPNGVDVDFWQAKKATAPKGKKFVFMSIGRLEPQKGYEYIIKAAARLASRRMLQITIVGDGGQRQALLDLSREYGVQDVVEFVGQKTPEEVRILLSRSDAAIFASLYETTPITLLEAWAAGVPVITTPVGIMRDEPPDTRRAYMVQTKDERSLSLAMQRCMSNRADRDRIAAAGNRSVQKYDWASITRKTEDLYGSIV